MRGYRGFTLLELLVAIAILAIIGMASWQLLHTVIKARESTSERAKNLDDLQRAVHLMVSDAEQFIDREVTDELGATLPALMTPREGGLELTVSGHLALSPERNSDLQRVRYQLKGSELHRYRWNALDRAAGDQPSDLLLLTDVTALQIRYMDLQGHWQATWPPAQAVGQESPARSPRALEISVTLKTFGEIRRLIVLPAGMGASHATT